MQRRVGHRQDGAALMTTENRAIFREVMRTTSSDLLGYFERRVRSPEDAADLLGETLLQAWRRAGDMPQDDPSRQRMWLFTIGGNVLANFRRSKRRKFALADRIRAHLQVAAQPPDIADANSVRDAVLRLDGSKRELIMLIHWDGFSVTEAAQILGLNPSTARGRYAKARDELRRSLSDSACAQNHSVPRLASAIDAEHTIARKV